VTITGIRANIPRIVFGGGMVRPWKTRAGWICQTFRWFGAEALYFAKPLAVPGFKRAQRGVSQEPLVMILGALADLGLHCTVP